MQTKKDQIQGAPAETAPSEQESGIQVSRRALYEQRLAAIAADRQAGLCTPEEGAERVVQALAALYGRFLTGPGREALKQHLRGEVEKDPELRKLFS